MIKERERTKGSVFLVAGGGGKGPLGSCHVMVVLKRENGNSCGMFKDLCC